MTVGNEAQAGVKPIMDRVGATCTAQSFVTAVGQAFIEVQHVSDQVMFSRFRRGATHLSFCQGVRTGMRQARNLSRALAVGCDSGWVARNAGYCYAVLREILPPDVKVECHNISPRTLRAATGRREYDLVVSYSLLHFIEDYGPVLKMIGNLVSPSGVYLAAGEPNRRFYQNHECVAAYRDMCNQAARRRRLTRFARPSFYWNVITRLSRKRDSFESRVNGILATRHAWHADLSLREIQSIVDPHMPTEPDAAPLFGPAGLDWNDFSLRGLSGFERSWVTTANHAGNPDGSNTNASIRQVTEALKNKYPLDGAIFSALWWKRASTTHHENLPDL